MGMTTMGVKLDDASPANGVNRQPRELTARHTG